MNIIPISILRLQKRGTSSYRPVWGNFLSFPNKGNLLYWNGLHILTSISEYSDHSFLYCFSPSNTEIQFKPQIYLSKFCLSLILPVMIRPPTSHSLFLTIIDEKPLSITLLAPPDVSASFHKISIKPKVNDGKIKIETYNAEENEA